MTFTLVSSLPVSIYFLGFLNYLSICSLYVLLNFKIPVQVYDYFASVYEQLNSSILSLFGIEVKLAPFSDEKVNS